MESHIKIYANTSAAFEGYYCMHLQKVIICIEAVQVSKNSLILSLFKTQFYVLLFIVVLYIPISEHICDKIELSVSKHFVTTFMGKLFAVSFPSHELHLESI